MLERAGEAPPRAPIETLCSDGGCSFWVVVFFSPLLEMVVGFICAGGDAAFIMGF